MPPTPVASTPVTLSSVYGVLAARGPDARKFLHGQLSQDVNNLATDRVALAGLHNPQGRTLAVLRVVPANATDLLLLLPRELVELVRSTLTKFVLRAKVTLTDESERWTLIGLPPNTVCATPSGFLWQHAVDGRLLHLTERSPADLAAEVADAALTRWHAADIAAGLPQVFAATSGTFVAQMLNLDVQQAIAFDKGCYTGQEVIARAHYRGRVKRRMQRFVTRTTATLQPGDSVTLDADRSGEVVDAVVLPDGRCEFLAVATFGASVSSTGVSSDSLPLPYALPD